MGYILKKKECAGELSKTKRPERPQKITKVFDCRILCLLNKNHHNTKPSKKNIDAFTNITAQSLQQGAKTLVTLSDVTSVRSILMCRGLYSLLSFCSGK